MVSYTGLLLCRFVSFGWRWWGDRRQCPHAGKYRTSTREGYTQLQIWKESQSILIIISLQHRGAQGHSAQLCASPECRFPWVPGVYMSCSTSYGWNKTSGDWMSWKENIWRENIWREDTWAPEKTLWPWLSLHNENGVLSLFFLTRKRSWLIQKMLTKKKLKI